MKITLCGRGDASCPAVDMSDTEVTIGEDGNTVKLKPTEWNRLVDLVKEGKLTKI